MPNIFSAFYRGDGRSLHSGAMGEHLVSILSEQYRVISAAWKIYNFSKNISRNNLCIDYDRWF